MLFCRVPTNVLKLMTQCKWGTSWFMDSCKVKLLNLLGLTDLFGKLYLRLSAHPLYPSPSQIKSYYVFGTKMLLRRYTQIYIHLLSKCFKNAVGVKKWCCTIFFSDTKQKHVFWKICIIRKVFGFLREYIVFNAKWVEVCKMSDLFR